MERTVVPKCAYRAEPILSVMAMLQERIVEFRRPQAVGYPVAVLV